MSESGAHIPDAAHRSQHGFIDGDARQIQDALPHTSFIGFTGTPIELAGANARAVFADNEVAAQAHLSEAQVKPEQQAAGATTSPALRAAAARRRRFGTMLTA